MYNSTLTSAASTGDWLYNNVDRLKVVDKLNYSNLAEIQDFCSELKDFKSIGSYNWSLKSKPGLPIVIVPGQADKLLKNYGNQSLTKSDYEQMVDENRYYMPDYPLEPLFRAVSHCTPKFDFNKVDFVTDRNNLRKLLNFVDKKCKDSFKIEFQCIGNLVILVRVDENTIQCCNDYGKDFEHKYTKPTLDQGAYRRIVTYKLGDFQIVTRFEVDCVEDDSQIDDLASSLSGLSLLNQNQSLQKFDQNGSKLSFYKCGQFNPNEKLVEMTTKSNFNNDFPESKWNQLFFSKTNVLFLGWHKRGMLQNIEKLAFDDVTKRCNRSKVDIQISISKLNHLLSIIKKVAIKNNDNSAETVLCAIYDNNENENCIKFYKCLKHQGSLPKSLFEEIKNGDKKNTKEEKNEATKNPIFVSSVIKSEPEKEIKKKSK